MLVFDCYALFYIHSSFAIILMRKRACCFAFIVFWMSYYCNCSVAFPQSAMGRSSVCHCSIFLIILIYIYMLLCCVIVLG